MANGGQPSDKAKKRKRQRWVFIAFARMAMMCCCLCYIPFPWEWQVRQQIEADVPLGSTRKMVEEWAATEFGLNGTDRIFDKGRAIGFGVAIPRKTLIQFAIDPAPGVYYSEVRIEFYFDNEQKLVKYHCNTHTNAP